MIQVLNERLPVLFKRQASVAKGRNIRKFLEGSLILYLSKLISSYLKFNNPTIQYLLKHEHCIFYVIYHL